MVVEAQIAHGEGERPRTRRVRVGEAAAVGAAAAVPRTVLLQGGEEAEAGKRVAERAVDEHLDLAAAAARDGADVLDGEFAGEDDAREAEFPQREHAFEVVGDELRGGVEFEVGEVAAHETRHAEILHDEAVRAQFVEQGELPGGLRQLGVVEKRVERDVDFSTRTLPVRGGEQVAQLRVREVDGVGARGKGVEAEIDGVCAGGEGGEGGFEGPGGGEEFDVVHGCSRVFYHIRRWAACARDAECGRIRA